MNKKFRLGVAAGITAAAILTVSTPVMASERISQQTLGSGPDVYRVEVRNLYRLEVLEAGDSDGVGELHELTIELTNYDLEVGGQYDRLKFSGTELYLINKGGIVGGTRHFPIRVGQHVFTANDRRRNNTTQMWVHVNTGAEPTAYDTVGRVRLSVSAEELDCAGQRVCNRRSNGRVTIDFKIPEFTSRPSNRCGPDNTFRLEPLDGEIQISGLSNTTVFSSTGSESWYLGINHEAGGPRLSPFNAEICIASTIRP